MLERISGRTFALMMLGVFLQLSSALPQSGLYAQTAPPSNGVASISPNPFDFGAQAVSTASAAQQFSLMNTGSGTLGSIAISLSNTDYALASNNCTSTLASGASCTFTVTFTPSFNAPDPGSIVVTDDAAVATTTGLLSGTGVTSVFILPFEMFFDGQAIGSTSPAQQATFTNNSDSPESISSVTKVGNAPGDFVLGPGCPANGTIEPTGNCVISVTFAPTVAGPRTADLTVTTADGLGPFVSHLTGNGAIRHLPGFAANILPPNDDGSTDNGVPLPFAVNFFGTSFTSLFVNNNGNVTFGDPLSEFTPTGLNSDNGGIPIIAPFWADVDTRGAEGAVPPSAVVTYGVDTVDGHQAFGVTYENVGYFAGETDKLNSFQLILIDRSDTGIAGAFDIEFDYDKIQWESGEASGGTDGLCAAGADDGCVSAAVGYSNGTGDAGTNFQLPGSFVPGALLDSGPAATALIATALNSTVPGRSVFQVRNGNVVSADLSLAMTQASGTVPAGSNQTYTLTVANAGPDDATNTTITDTLPTNATLVSATPSQGSACTGTTTLTCNLGTVANAGSATLVIVVTVNANATGSLANSATVVSDLPDPNMQNNSASVTATIGAATNFALTVTEAGSGAGTVTSAPTGINCPTTCAANFAAGTQVTLTPTASTGSAFAGWSGACTGTASCVVTMSAAEAVTATFNASTTAALTVTDAGTGTGTVTSNPAGINCPSACVANFATGTQVSLTATPSAGSTFAGWSGACTGTTSCVVTMTAAKAVTATFNAAAVALTITDAGTGTGTVTSAPAGINCRPTCTANFPSGTQITLTATPASGSTFTGWGGAACEGTSTCTFLITAATTVIANFGTVNFALTVAEAGTGQGTVTSAPTGINCPETCAANFASGTQVTLTPTASEGSTFVRWNGACTGSAGCVVTMNAAKAVTATFNTATVALTITDAGTGTGTVTSSPAGISCRPTCTANFTSGTQVTLTATPASGSTFTGWGGTACEGTSTCTFTITAATTVIANFGGGTGNFALTVAEAGSGQGMVTSSPAGINCPSACSANFASGTQVTLTQAASTGSAFAGWSGACSGTGACVVAMTAAEAVTATFNTSNSVIISVPSGGSTTATTTSGGTAFYGLMISGPPGVTGTVQLSCASSSPSVTCTVIPSTVTLNGKSTTEVAFGIQTFCQGSNTASLPAGFGGPAMLLMTMLLGGIVWMFNRNRRVALGFAMLALVALGMGSCGSLPKGPNGATPAGTYFISLSTTLNHQTQTLQDFLTLVVK